MSEFDFDDLLTGAVNDYREATLSQIKPAGALAARATATHRRRVHMISMSVLAAVLVITLISAYAASDHNHNGPPTVATSPTVTPTIAPSTVGPSTAPSTPPSTPPSNTPATTSVAPITEHDLGNATLTIPSSPWSPGCPHGKVKLTNGRFVWNTVNNLPGDANYGLLKVVSVDVDGDGTKDAIALFGCDEGDPGMQIVVGFDRTSSGAIHTMGNIVPDTSTVLKVSAGSGGKILVQVSNLEGTDGVAASEQVVQSRTYAWSGTKFRQTAGPTAFTTSSSLSAQMSDLTFAKSSNGKRAGVMTVQLHNTGSHSISNASVVVYAGETIGLVMNAGCQKLPWDTDLADAEVCSPSSIAAGGTATVTLHFTIADDRVSDIQHYGLVNAQMTVQIRVDGKALTQQPKLGKAVFN